MRKIMSGTCPICDGKIGVSDDVEVSEVVSCPECSNQLVVKDKNDTGVVLEEAPEVEEDWGE